MINVNFALVLNWYSDGKIKGKINVDTLYTVFENHTKSLISNIAGGVLITTA